MLLCFYTLLIIERILNETELINYNDINALKVTVEAYETTYRGTTHAHISEIEFHFDLKNNVVTEVRNIKNDIKNRFVHKPEMVNEMRNEKIVITGQPIEIVPVENLSMSMQM